MRHLLLARTYQEARTFAYNHCIPRGCWAFIIDLEFVKGNVGHLLILPGEYERPDYQGIIDFVGSR